MVISVMCRHHRRIRHRTKKIQGGADNKKYTVIHPLVLRRKGILNGPEWIIGRLEVRVLWGAERRAGSRWCTPKTNVRNKNQCEEGSYMCRYFEDSQEECKARGMRIGD